MSELIKDTHTVSNEDVIEELTKDLKGSLTTEEKLDDFTINPGNSSHDLPTTAAEASKDTASHIPSDPYSDFDKDEPSDKEDDGSDTDSIDEVALKDAELELTDDLREERRIIAEELKVVGNDVFKSGEYERSREKYTDGLKICPLKYSQLRSVLYCNRSAAKLKLEKYKSAIKDCTKALELDDKYVKAYLRRANCYEKADKLDEALADYKKVLEIDPAHTDSIVNISRLEPLIAERNEKLKTEMLGKLKDLGNMILKPFGLSTENFKLEQDPESKGYKINFQQ